MKDPFDADSNSDESLSDPAAPGSDSGANHDVGVGLSDPQVAQGRRRMLDLVNRLHSTGWAVLLFCKVTLSC